MRGVWLFFLCIYLLSLIPAGFTAFAAFAQRDVDLSGDAWRATIILTIYLIGAPLLLLFTKPRHALKDKEAAE